MTIYQYERNSIDNQPYQLRITDQHKLDNFILFMVHFMFVDFVFPRVICFPVNKNLAIENYNCQDYHTVLSFDMLVS